MTETDYNVKRVYDALIPEDENDTEQNESNEFQIQDDGAADWAIRKIREEEMEYRRIADIAEQVIAESKEKVERAAKRCDSRTSYLKSKLAEYFELVPHRKTKTQETYALLSGKLIKKFGGVKSIVDDDKLLTWLQAAERDDLIKVEKKPRWGDLKKELDLTRGDNAVHKETGEIVDGVALEQAPDTFAVDIDL